MDATSWRVFLEDLNLAYRMRPLQRRSGSHIDYTMKQLRNQESGHFQPQLEFWKLEYASLPQVLPLMPMARFPTRPSAQASFKTHYAWREIDSDLLSHIKTACRIIGVTPFHFHLAAVQALLAASLGIQDITIGVADSNRVNKAFAETVGFFMNLLPVRFEVSKDLGFSQLARNTARKVFAALENSAVPFDMILDTLKVPRSSSHTPLFQVAVNYRNGSLQDVPLGSNTMTMNDAQDARNPYDMSFGIVEISPTCSMVEITFQESLYGLPACHDILDTLVRLLRTFAANPNHLVGECQVNRPEDVFKALDLGHGPQIRFDWPSTLSKRVLNMCHMHAEKAAITDKSSTIPYSELITRINSLAAALHKVGCVPGSRVAVLCEPSTDFIISLLAILHVGGVYVPLDVSLPPARHESIIHESEPSLLLDHAATGRISDNLAQKFHLSKIRVDDINKAVKAIPCAAEPNSPAFLLFTSGSTGNPKGLILSQANFVNFIAAKSDALGLAQGCESVLQQSSFGFDMSLVQTFSALANGGTLVIVPADARRDPGEITQLILRHRITLTIATPSENISWLQYGSSSLDQCSSWRNACMGGEPVPSQLQREFKRLNIPGMTLTDWYGPTEITAAATFRTVPMDVEDDDTESKSTVGKPLANCFISILDPQHRPLPVGMWGEICIGGAGVALGYLNLPTQTAQKFISSDSSDDSSDDSTGRVYRTGDMGRLNPDRTLTLMGRIDGDTQVKLRGLRIELMEVEAALLSASMGALLSVVVSVRGDVLIAHAVATSESRFGNDEAHSLLNRLPLPQYMHPALVIMIDRLPVTSNGKVDRKAVGTLPVPENSWTASAQPGRKLSLKEGELSLLWLKVLAGGKHKLGPDSDFFLEGGNSTRLIKLQHAIMQEMGISISARDLYQASTLRRMAALIDAQQQEGQLLEDTEIDWATETAVTPTTTLPPLSPVGALPAKRCRNAEDGIQVLLTGATNFLGGATLKALIHAPSVSTIHCVAIPPDEQDHLPASRKVTCYTGTLSSPTLGLSQTEYTVLQSCTDVILHAGASGHCLNSYPSLRAPNVHSTRFLASLAITQSIPLLYLSSNRVTLLSGDTSVPPVSMASHPPPTTRAEGFTASKWASECFLENVVRHLDSNSLAIEIHRPCVTISDQAPSSDALNAILRYSLLMKCVPSYAKMEGYFDFKNVDDVASELASAALSLALADQLTEGGAVGIRYRHHSSHIKVPMDNVKGYLEEIHGCSFEELDIQQWIRNAVNVGMDPLIATYIESLVEGGNTLRFAYLGEGVGQSS
ncbi:hypothetical protein BJX63DRAFT_433986 [Aspergillus granulosus]|uniref:Carrier domain-containing protein n=1 Tax=Aspergillus granulosus TaxID=176169 RepID=A0ABR4H5Q7_9EURO